MARKRISIEEEDATSQAGWLFADSFLALMVIFLATISFVPVIGGGGVLGTGKVGKIAGSNYVDGLVLAYEDVDVARITNDIETELSWDSFFEKLSFVPLRMVFNSVQV